MTHKPLYTSPMGAWLIAGMFAAFASSVIAQDYYPIVEDRVDGGVPQPELVEFDERKHEGWNFAATVSAAYDDNIFLSSENPESAMVFRVAPTIFYTKGDDVIDAGEGAFIKVTYRPTGVVYSDDSGDNRVDQQGIIAAGWSSKDARVSYVGAVQKLGGATAETGLPTDRVEYENELRAAWIVREKVSLEGAVGYGKSDYRNQAYYDSSNTYGEIGVRYTYSPKTAIGMAYRVGRFKVDGSGPQDTQSLTGNVSWQPREKIRVNLAAGGEYRKYDNGSQVKPVLEGRVDWAPRQETELFLTAYMREEASAYYEGQNYSVKGMSAGVSQRLGPDWKFVLEGGYETNKYEAVSGAVSSDRDDRLWFVRPALTRQMGAESDISFFYQISNNDSSDSGFGYDQQMLGVELNHNF